MERHQQVKRGCKIDIRIDREKQLMRFYPLGSVRADGSPSAEELGTAVLLSKSRLKVRTRLPNGYNLDLDTILAQDGSD